MWTVLTPLLQYLVIGVVFWYAARVQSENYFAYFFTGSVVFNIFSLTINRSPAVMLNNEHFIKKIYLPKMIYVLNLVLYEMVNFLLSSFALLILGTVTKQIVFSWALVFLPIALILIAPALLGISCILGVGGVYFRDLNYIVPPVMQAAFFMTPIAYNISILPEKLQFLMNFNPFFCFIELIRYPIVFQSLPPSHFILGAVGFSTICLIFGLWVIYKFDNRIIFKL